MKTDKEARAYLEGYDRGYAEGKSEAIKQVMEIIEEVIPNDLIKMEIESRIARGSRLPKAGLLGATKNTLKSKLGELAK